MYYMKYITIYKLHSAYQNNPHRIHITAQSLVNKVIFLEIKKDITI